MTQEPQEFVAPQRVDQPPTTNQDIDFPTEADKEPQPLEPDWSEDRPIPVYVVDREETPQISEWSSVRFGVTDQPVELAGSRRNRNRLLIRNEGVNEVYLGNDMTVNSMNYGLPANAEVEMLHNGSVWARCASGESATVNIIQEYTVELDSPHA